MMTQMQTNGNTCSPEFLAYLFPHDEGNCAKSQVHMTGRQTGGGRQEQKEIKFSSKGETSDQKMAEMPLWPSLKSIRPTSWKEDVKQALNYRSVFIGATVLSIMAFGLILAV